MTLPGYGTINNAMELSVALSYGFISPGDTIYLRGGTYSGDFACSLNGTPDNPIIVKPYVDEFGNQEHPIISGDFSVLGAYVHWYDIEFCKLDWVNRVDYPEDDLMVYGSGTKFINCDIHDLYLFGFWERAEELYGCNIWNNGVTAGSHSLYTQNFSSTYRKCVKHNVVGKSFNFNLHAFSTTVSNRGFDFIQNVLMPGQNLYGGDNKDYDVMFSGTCTYGTRLAVGYDNPNSGSVLINNYLMNPSGSAFQFIGWTDCYLKDNVIISGQSGTARDLLVFQQVVSPGTQYWDYNNYYNLGNELNPFVESGVSDYTFIEWQADKGFDANGSYSTSNPSDVVFVWPNDYADVSKRRGMVVVYNHSKSNSVSVDISSLNLSSGTSYNLIQSTDPYVDVVEFTYDGGEISIDMRASEHSIAIPIMYDKAIAWQTFPIFGCFIIEKA